MVKVIILLYFATYDEIFDNMQSTLAHDCRKMQSFLLLSFQGEPLAVL